MEEDERFVSEEDWFWSDPDIDLTFSVGSHVCAAYREEATTPSHSGEIVVTQYCACGRICGSYRDSVM